MSLKRDHSVGDLPNNTDDWVQKKARRSGKNKEKKQQGSTPSSQSIDDAISAVLNDNPQQSCNAMEENRGSSSSLTVVDDITNTTQAQLESMR